MSLSKEIEIARSAVIEAGNYLANLDIKNVDSTIGKDIKLEADRKSEEILVGFLQKSQLPILSEESGAIGEQKGLRWIIDPIDGTFNYFRGLKDLCCISVALWEDDTPIFGIINRFSTNEIYEGLVGKYLKINDQIAKTSDIVNIEQAVYATGFAVKRNYNKDSLDEYIKPVQLFKKIRLLGSAALMSSFVGIGYFDIYVEDDIMLWDIAAGAAIIKAGGGEISYKPNGSFKCDFKGFANKELMENYYARL
jgi:myo-inositol-1(or 4)-monophosphatase